MTGKQTVKLDNVEKMAETYFVLSSPVRLKILEICQHSPTTIKRLIQMLDRNSSAVGAHIKLLHQTGMIEKIRNKDNSVTVRSLVEIDEKGRVKL
jgi:predicted transcriptional regulator